MQKCFERTKREVHEDNTEWLKPVQILEDSIQDLGLARFIRQGISNREMWKELEPFLSSNRPIPEDYYVLHWCHEIWRSLELDKNHFCPDSTFAALLRQFNVV